MEINQSELSQHEFEKMLGNLRNQRRDSDRNPSCRVFRIVEAIRERFCHDSFDLLENPIEEILAEYEFFDCLKEYEKGILLADLFKIAEQREFTEMERLALQQMRESGMVSEEIRDCSSDDDQ